jgi:hypothetical protein
VDGKLGLFAQIDPTDELVAMTKKRQKIFSSMEVQPSFADTGEAYLVGLAVTDNPASLGCDVLKFSAQAPVNPLSARKLDPANVFTEAVEVDVDLSQSVPADTPPVPSRFAESIKALFSKQRKADDNTDARFADTQEAIQAVAAQVQIMGDQVIASFKTINDQLAALKAQADERDKAFNALKTGLETTEAYTARPPATGGDGNTEIKTDC